MLGLIGGSARDHPRHYLLVSRSMVSAKGIRQTGISENHPTDFQRECLDLVNRLVPLSSSAFYLVNVDMQHRGILLRNIEVAVERDYQRKFQEIDPLRPALFEGTDVRVACIDEQLGEAELLASPYYQQFMQPLQHRHVADMFFRRGQDIVAVVTMLRDAQLGPFTGEELGVLRDVQPFMEYALNTVYLPKRYRERDSVQMAYGLTARELDVVELIIVGSNNKLIARELGLSLATVKTHVQNVFKKLDVTSRTALSARVLGSLSR
ncbi:MAG: LuxR C-terminal-related transcriptional regulator [Pseudomonadota bacterium]